jgi:hypothetical protein
MRLFPFYISIAALALVGAFQACTPMSGTRSGETHASVNQSQDPKQASIGSSANDAILFHGKVTTIYQDQDKAFCKSVNATASVRQEIVHDNLGTWLTVNNCHSTSARNVEGQVVTNSDNSNVVFQNRLLSKIVKKNPFEHARISCYNRNANVLDIVVYESADGLVLDYTRFRRKHSEFTPVTATHRFAPTPQLHPSGFIYDSSYKAAFWNKDFRGQLNLRLNTQDPSKIMGMWYMKYAAPGTAESGGQGECKVEPFLYPW